MRASMRENMRTGRKDATLIRVEFHVTVTKIGGSQTLLYAKQNSQIPLALRPEQDLSGTPFKSPNLTAYLGSSRGIRRISIGLEIRSVSPYQI